MYTVYIRHESGYISLHTRVNDKHKAAQISWELECDGKLSYWE
jgi:hypothetical protein